MKVLKALLRILCVFLIVAAISAAVFFRPNSAVEMSGEVKNTYADNTAFFTGGKYKKIASAGFTELYFNESSASIAVRDTSIGKAWYSCDGGSDSDVIMRIRTSDSEYVLTSNQCVKNGDFKSRISENGVSVEYDLAFEPNGAVYKVAVDYTLKDGNLFVKAGIESDNAGSAAVTSFKVLPFFGAFDNPSQDDYLVLPDGCGAAVYPYYAEKIADYTCRVYGADLSYEKNNGASSLFGAFGLKYGDRAFAAIINKGEEYAGITAHCDKKNKSYICADFCFDGIYEKNGKAYTHYGAERSVEICYKFLSAENASYSEIASSCREQFIRSGVLPAASVKNSDNLPMFLTLNGAYKSNANIPAYEKLTTFDQALDIIKRIKSKGIDNINVRYKNVYAPGSPYAAAALGSKKDLKELTDYTSSLNVPLYFDANISAYMSHFGNFTLFGAKQADKMPYSVVNNLACDGLGELSFKYRFRTPDGTGGFVSRLIDKAKDYNVTGLCVNDAGRYLCSDFSGSSSNRCYVKDYISSQFPAMQNAGGVCVENGNIYTIKNSSAVIDIPMSTYYEQSESYQRIPFVQTVYHGITVLAGEPINAKSDIHGESLRCIEYGVCPNFSAVFSGTENAAVLIKNASDIIVKEYNFMSDAVSSLEGERITDHFAVKDGVFCTTFSSGTMIYVNYNKEKAVINGLTVQGNSYLKIK
ncbi:MAG: hypothetical protein IJU45_08935 [Clostridia bacterium]|nr:hypothetical protein [Clostridia bacterium]